jgi:hypothetical protein
MTGICQRGERTPSTTAVCRRTRSQLTAIRSERYYQAARPTPAQRISPEGLDILKRIQSAGEVAQLVLDFGPHAGETLGQVAKSDPDYLRRLALTAQRPDVRAAAASFDPALGSCYGKSAASVIMVDYGCACSCVRSGTCAPLYAQATLGR